MSIYQPTFTIGDRLAGIASTLVRRKSPGHKLAVRAATAAASFPNDTGGYFRREPRDESCPPNTPERNRQLLALAYSEGPKPIIMPRKPSRREAIIGHRIAEGRMRRPLKDHPLGQRRAAPRVGIETRTVLGKRCRIAAQHLCDNGVSRGRRAYMPQDLSVNAVAERKSRGLTALGYSSSPTTSA